jgi:hypothetical protein
VSRGAPPGRIDGEAGGAGPGSTIILNYVIRFGVFTTALLAAFIFVRQARGLPLDDAYIHLVFARNLGGGSGYSFNPGEFSLGFSSPLWVMLLSVLERLGMGLVKGAGFLSLVFFAASTVLLFELVRVSISRAYDGITPTPDKRWIIAFSLVAGLGMIASGNMLWLAGAGMEAMLFLCLGLATILLLHSEKPRPVAGGVTLGLLLLTRPTGIALWILLLVLVMPAAKKRSILTALAVSLLIAAPWSVFSLLKTGFILPPTRAGKLASSLFNTGLSLKGFWYFSILHVRYLAISCRGTVVLMVIALAAGAVSLFIARSPKAADNLPESGGRETESIRDRLAKATGAVTPAGVLVLWAIAHFSQHALFFRSTIKVTPYNNLRYQAMLIPAIIAAAALILSILAARIAGTPSTRKSHAPESGENSDAAMPGYPGRRPPGALAITCAAALLLFMIPLGIELGNAKNWRLLYLRHTDHLQKVHRAAAEWARDSLPAEARIAALDIGVLGFYSGRYVIDQGGLVDTGILPHLDKHRTGPYLVEKGATHYFALVRYDSDATITGVKADAGRLYGLQLIKRFNYPSFPQPVFLHSLGIEIFEIIPAAPGKNR